MRKLRLTRDGRQRIEDELAQSRERLAEFEEAIRQMLLCKCDWDQLTLSEARERKMALEQSVAELEGVLQDAATLPAAIDRAGSVVDLGAFVALREAGSGEELVVQVVAAPEAAASGAALAEAEVARISEASPLGSRLLGRGVGDTVTVPLAGNEARYTVRSVRY